MTRGELQADKYWFRFQGDAPEFFHLSLDVVLRGEDFICRSPAMIDQSQRVFRGDTNPPERISTAEPGVFDQPRGRDFVALRQPWVTGDHKISGYRPSLQIVHLLIGDHGIFEE